MLPVVLTISEFLGHLHPLFVHLPIGILLMACLFIWLSKKEKFRLLEPAIPFLLFTGMISAVFTCITGYLLSDTGEYDEELVQVHQWMGILVAALSIGLYFLYKKNRAATWMTPAAILLGIAIGITGHLGGSLTHGSDYLTKPFKNLAGDSIIRPVKRKPIANIQEAFAYADIVEPVFQEKCYSCHSSLKQKGKLRLDDSAFIMKGGKEGVVIVAGKADESELMKRILTTRETEHHMPPKEKPQLSETETTLLQWWVNGGACFTKKVKDIPQPEKIKILLAGLQNISDGKKNPSTVPAGQVEQADEKDIRALKAKGVILIPVSQNSHYLAANFVTAVDFSDRDIHLLLPFIKQLVWLKIGHTMITDAALITIGQCTNLTALQLNNTGITDEGLGYLKSLKNLQTLNLVGTKISSYGILKLEGLKQLRSIYVYQTTVEKKDWSSLQKAFPETSLDSGGYKLPYLETDTQQVKSPVKY